MADDNRGYLQTCRLLDALMAKHFPEHPPLIKSPTIEGVIDQIDNLTTALVRK